ncbi:hypothetical protein Tco_1480539, partial [Tanacetum coccineum]
AFPTDMSSGNMCHGGTNYLTEKYVGPTVLLGIVTGELIPGERSPATNLQGNVSQRQVAWQSPKMSLGIVVNVVVRQYNYLFIHGLAVKQGKR